MAWNASEDHPFISGVATDPERVAFVIDGTPWTAGALNAASLAYAAGLRARGVQSGERIAVMGPSAPGLLMALLGHLRSGVVHVPINTAYRGEEIGHILRDSGARALVQWGEAGSCSAGIAAASALNLPVWRVDEVQDGSGSKPLDCPMFQIPAPDDLAMLIYTSGTTGPAKGVAQSHRALVANIGATTGLWQWTSADRLSLMLPLFHVHGLGLGVLGSLMHRVTALVHRRFEAAAVVDDFEAQGATIFMGVPTMHARILAHLNALVAERGADGVRSIFANARLFTSGSAALPADDLERFRALSGLTILERYGMSETGFTLSNPYVGERRAGTVGFAVPGYEVRVVGDDGQRVPEGEMGEIQVRGDGMMDGYWNQPEATAKSFTEDGWFQTGDLAHLNDADEGAIRIVGRRSADLIKSGGYKISAREIEEVLLRHPEVAEVAVVGMPDPIWGESITAVIVLAADAEPGDPTREARLQSHSRALLADFKRPRQVVEVQSLPRNALGKLQKHRLKSSLAAQRAVKPAR